MSVNISGVSSQSIHAQITMDRFEDWLFSAVYASPNPRTPEGLWEDMENHARSSNNPWLVAGNLMIRYFGRKVEASRLIRVQAKEESLRLTSTTPISLIWVRLDPNSRGIMVDKVGLISKSVLTELFVTRSGMHCSRKVWSKPSLGLIPIMILFLFLSMVTPFPVELIGLFRWRRHGLLILLLRMS